MQLAVGEHVRQGDIFIERVEKSDFPDELVALRPDTDGSFVIAEGEATGHHHRLSTDGEGGLAVLEADDDNDRWVTISAPLAELTHDEHDTLELDEGDYHMYHQREHVEQPNKVEDLPALPPRQVYD